MTKVLKRLTAVAAALVLAVTSGTVQQVSAAGSNTVMNEITVTYDQSGARTMLDMVNEFRTGSDAWAWDQSGQREEYAGLQELTYDPVLEKVAMQRAAEIIFNWSHTRPNGESCFTAFPDSYTAVGKILLWDRRPLNRLLYHGGKMKMIMRDRDIAGICLDVILLQSVLPM